MGKEAAGVRGEAPSVSLSSASLADDRGRMGAGDGVGVGMRSLGVVMRMGWSPLRFGKTVAL
jgi:hypothetical protein